MSQYLNFYLRHVDNDRVSVIPLTDYSRNTKMFEAFSYVPYGDLKKITVEMLTEAKTNLFNDKLSQKKAKKKLIKERNELMLNLAYDDKIKLYERYAEFIQEYDESIEEIKFCINDLAFMISIIDFTGVEMYAGVETFGESLFEKEPIE